MGHRLPADNMTQTKSTLTVVQRTRKILQPLTKLPSKEYEDFFFSYINERDEKKNVKTVPIIARGIFVYRS